MKILKISLGAIIGALLLSLCSFNVKMLKKVNGTEVSSIELGDFMQKATAYGEDDSWYDDFFDAAADAWDSFSHFAVDVAGSVSVSYDWNRTFSHTNSSGDTYKLEGHGDYNVVIDSIQASGNIPSGAIKK